MGRGGEGSKDKYQQGREERRGRRLNFPGAYHNGTALLDIKEKKRTAWPWRQNIKREYFY